MYRSHSPVLGVSSSAQTPHWLCSQSLDSGPGLSSSAQGLQFELNIRLHRRFCHPRELQNQVERSLCWGTWARLLVGDLGKCSGLLCVIGGCSPSGMGAACRLVEAGQESSLSLFFAAACATSSLLKTPMNCFLLQRAGLCRAALGRLRSRHLPFCMPASI